MKKFFTVFFLFSYIFLMPFIVFAGEEPAYTVVPFKGEDEKLSFDLAEMLMADLAKSGSIKLVDRLHFDNILDELAKMELALIKEEDIIDFGLSEGADKIISGSYQIVDENENIAIQIWVSDTETSVVDLSDSIEGNKKDVFYFVHQLANRIHYKLTGSWIPEETYAMASPQIEVTPVPAATPVTPQYINPRPEETDPYLFLPSSEKDWDNTVELSVDRGDFSTYSNGERMVISYRASKDCYMTIYSIETDGSVHLVFPNKFYKDNFVKGGIVYTIPSEKDFWEYVMEGSPGLESLMAIASEKPLEVELSGEDFAGVDFMPRVNESPSEFILENIIPGLNINPENKWTAKILKYYLAE